MRLKLKHVLLVVTASAVVSFFYGERVAELIKSLAQREEPPIEYFELLEPPQVTETFESAGSEISTWKVPLVPVKQPN